MAVRTLADPELADELQEGKEEDGY